MKKFVNIPIYPTLKNLSNYRIYTLWDYYSRHLQILIDFKQSKKYSLAAYNMPDLDPAKRKHDPELESRWFNWKVGFGALLSVAGTIAVAERLKGDERRELGSYYRSIKQVLSQRERFREDPLNILIELPENRTVTRIISLAASTIGFPIHQYGEEIPRYGKIGTEDELRPVIPDFVENIRAYRVQGSQLFLYEEVDLLVGGGEKTIYALVGRANALIFYHSPEPNRALRILSNYKLGRQAMQERGLIYIPPSESRPPIF